MQHLTCINVLFCGKGQTINQEDIIISTLDYTQHNIDIDYSHAPETLCTIR